MTSELLNDLAHQIEWGKRISVHPIPSQEIEKASTARAFSSGTGETNVGRGLFREVATDLRGDYPKPDKLN